jgi:CheY-like chemotaxis protein
LETLRNGESAVIRLVDAHEQADDFHLVLLDWKMPGMDGLETARQIRRKLPHVLILILTAYDYTDIEDDARSAGINGFLQKPFFVSSLQNALRELEAVAGKGAEAAQAGKKEAGASEPEKEREKDIFDGLKVLASEDNEINAEILKAILQRNGATVTIVGNGKEALDEFRECEAGTYDVLLSDIQMPVMDGYESAKAIRALASDPSVSEEKRQEAVRMPIIAMTANAFNEDIQKSLLAGMNAHVSKPLDLEVLRKALRQVLPSGK